MKKIHIAIQIDGSQCDMEIDKGSSLMIVSWEIRKAVPGIKKRDLSLQRVQLKDYQGNRIPVIGSRTFRVKFREFFGPLKITVVSDALPSLFGLDWFKAVGMGVTGINTVHDDDAD